MKDSIILWNLTPIFQTISQTLESSFSAVWTATIASKGAFFSEFLNIYKICALLYRSNLEMFTNVGNIFAENVCYRWSNLTEVCQNLPEFDSTFGGLVAKFRHALDTARRFSIYP